jgi:glycosyltransferase involved in cell wall biosynthesis
MGKAPDNKINIAVCVPTHDMVPALFANDLAGMLAYTADTVGDRVRVNLLMLTNTYIQQARNRLVRYALEHKHAPHYLLFIDSDMRFPKDALFRALAHDKDVVAANYPTRQSPTEFISIKHRGWPEGHVMGDLRGNRLPTLEESEGLEKAHAVGGGFLLLKAHIFDKLPQPWFHLEAKDGGVDVVGEDVYFCRLLEDAGIDVWVDHDLSKMVGHIGQFIYKTEHAADVWQVMEEQHGARHIHQSEDGDRGASESD